MVYNIACNRFSLVFAVKKNFFGKFFVALDSFKIGSAKTGRNLRH